MDDDTISRIEAALEAGPTPGPWIVMPRVAGEQCVAMINALEVVPPGGVELARDSIDADYIAACNPVAIRTLLDRLKDLESNGSQAVRWAPSSAHWSSELRRLFGADARDGIDALEQRLRDAEQRAEYWKAEHLAANTEIARLREALVISEAALADIGDADREPGDDLAWCEHRAAAALPSVRAALENTDER